MTSPSHEATTWQASLFDFAIRELVRQNRQSFTPLWTVESWAKLLIWLALSCGCATDQAALEEFAAGLGPALSGRMRRVFFQRELEDLNWKVLADPADDQVLALPLDAGEEAPDASRLLVGLERVGLRHRVVAPERWLHHEALIALPWLKEEAPCG